MLKTARRIPVCASTLFKIFGSEVETTVRIGKNAAGIVSREMRARKFEWSDMQRYSGTRDAAARQKIYSAMPKFLPNLTGRVFLPACLSVAMSLILFTVRMAVENKPGARPAIMTL